MAQSLDEQVMTIERALGERMIESAMLIVRAWMNELGEENKYEETHSAIRKQYNELFSVWLTSDKEDTEERLNSLTGDAYHLVDAVYADIRIKRGLSPDMHGFNADSHQSVANYFASCVRFRDEDLEWLHEALSHSKNKILAITAVSALSHNLRECFSAPALQTMIECMNAEEEVVADQCIANVLMLLIQYDVRIDFFPYLQDAFVAAIGEMDGGDEHVFRVLCALCESTDIFRELVKAGAEAEYMKGLMQLMPHTWVYDVLVAGNEERERTLAHVAIKAGYREIAWDYPDIAEQVYLEKLRKGKGEALDYIYYAHCLLLKGDRLMAFENYKQARQMFNSVKEFYALFRPDRSALVDHGVPLEQVYLIEDQLFNA